MLIYYSAQKSLPTGEKSEILESSAINDGRSMLAVLYKVEGIETETLK